MDDITQAIAEFAPNRLLEDPHTVDSGIYLFILGFLVLVLLIGLAFSLMPDRFARGNRLHRRLFATYGGWAAWFAGAGLLVIGLRYVNVPLFSKRIWTLLDLAAILAVGAYALWYRIARYPDDRADYLEELRRRRYISAGGRRRRR